MWLSSIFRIAWLISRMLKGWRKPNFFQFKMITAISYKSLDKMRWVSLDHNDSYLLGQPSWYPKGDSYTLQALSTYCVRGMCQAPQGEGYIRPGSQLLDRHSWGTINYENLDAMSTCKAPYKTRNLENQMDSPSLSQPVVLAGIEGSN